MKTPLQLETEAPEGWFSQYDIQVLLDAINKVPKHGLYLEIGVHKGRSLWVAKQIADPSVEIWGIDVVDDPKIPGTNFIQADSQTYKWDREIDLLFIDADHSYPGCAADIAAYAPHVKPGGTILFHDCDDSGPGVEKAVKEFAAKNKLKVKIFKKFGHNTSIAGVVI